jgi:uncharacterized membrane protein YecN with MAPEG domain
MSVRRFGARSIEIRSLPSPANDARSDLAATIAQIRRLSVHQLPVTSLYAGILGLLLVALSMRVIIARRQLRINLGTSGNELMERWVRAQANLTEYAPMAIILLGLLEVSGSPKPVLHGLGMLLVGGRVLHAWAFSFTRANPFGRVGGMALTLTAIGAAAILNLI